MKALMLFQHMSGCREGDYGGIYYYHCEQSPTHTYLGVGPHPNLDGPCRGDDGLVDEIG